MEQTNLDVQEAPSTSITTDVNPADNQGANPQASGQQAEVKVSPVLGADNNQVNEDLDDKGVSWKNRAMEAQRKLESYQQQLEQVKAVTQPAQQQEYSVEELAAFVQTTNDPLHKQWAQKEIQRLEEKKVESLVNAKVMGWKQQEESQRVRQTVYQDVVTRNPEIVVRDNAGNFVGWNMSNPVTQRMDAYMRNPEIANHPRGLEIAEAFALRDVHVMNKRQTINDVQKLKNENANLKQKTMIEGSGVNSVPSNLNSVADRFNKKGNVNDAASLLKGHFKKVGTL